MVKKIVLRVPLISWYINLANTINSWRKVRIGLVERRRSPEQQLSFNFSNLELAPLLEIIALNNTYFNRTIFSTMKTLIHLGPRST